LPPENIATRSHSGLLKTKQPRKVETATIPNGTKLLSR
jgi:hypothetical protein